MKTLFCLLPILPLFSNDWPPADHRAAAIESARTGQWRTAESHQRKALAACQDCSAEELALLRSELAGYLVLGGFPEAAVPLWKQSLATLPAGSASRPAAYLGLGVALQAAGRENKARQAWNQACQAPSATAAEDAACRFNIAVATIGSKAAWSELEQLLPTLLQSPGSVHRATAYIQTARAALLAGSPDRARQLLDQADTLILAELDANHPFRKIVFELRAQTAERSGDRKTARLWRKRAAKSPDANGWTRGTISLEDLKRNY